MKYIIFIIFLFSFAAYGSQVVVVTADKAVIFADKYMKVPLGYVRGGKKIRTGKIGQKGSTLLPVIIARKVTYIQAKDVEVLAKADQKKAIRTIFHDVDRALMKDSTRLNQNNFFSLEVGQTDLGPQWKDFSEVYGDTIKPLTTLGITIEHRSTQKKFLIDLYLARNNVTQETLELSFTTAGAGYGHRFFKLEYLNLYLFGRVFYSGDAKLKSKASTNLTSTDFLIYGGEIGAKAIFFPTNDWAISANLSSRQINFSSYNNGEIDGPVDIKDLGGLSFFFQLTKKI